jgi:hypothetical protein
MVPVIVGDRVRIVSGLATGREGVVRRTQRQRKGERKAVFWVEVGPGEEHAFFREELTWTGEVYLPKDPAR